MTGKELSAVLAECAARTEIARAGVEEARRRQEEVAAEQTETIGEHRAAIVAHERVAAEQRVITEKLNKQHVEASARLDAYLEQSARKTDAILAELREAQDERRAMIEALFRVIDRLDNQPPPPPRLRSA